MIDKNTSNNETLLLSKIGSRIAVNKDIVDKQTNANDTFDSLIDSKKHTQWIAVIKPIPKYLNKSLILVLIFL